MCFSSLLFPIESLLVCFRSPACFPVGLVNGGRQDANSATRYRLLARGEADCDNRGCGYEIAQ